VQVALNPRLLIGQRGNDYGMWLSKRGKDATTATDDDMLISPTANNFQFFANGVVDLKALTDVSVNYGIAVDEIPLVYSQFAVVNQDLPEKPYVSFVPDYQANPAARQFGLFSFVNKPSVTDFLPPRYSIFPSYSSMVVKNVKNFNYLVRYMVIALENVIDE
jgi:hypothetical protein